MDLSRYLSTKKRKDHRQSSEFSSGLSRPRRHLPIVASPVDDDVFRSLSKGERVLSSKVSFSSSKSHVIYKHHEEASTIELFYDLFFVGNLAYFTAMHQHVDAESILNYLKLFTLMWFTWLSTVLYDVRFAADSILNRICKAVHFGVMAGFVFGGPIFDSSDKGVIDVNAFKAFALILMVSRAILAFQYGLVMWQSRAFKSSLLPLGLTVTCNVLSSAAFLAAHFVFPNGKVSWFHLLFLFLVAIFDGLATMLIAIFWRTISFKHTHLVERVGLLSLIIMGEGIIGMVKSISCITKGQSSYTSSEIGTVVSAVLLIYLIWMLYFDQIEQERFGTIRQQIWALLHYPLHIAILLLVEGNTSLIVWNSVVQGLKFVWGLRPADLTNPGAAFATSGDFINDLNASMWRIDAQFKSKSWKASYNWDAELNSIANISTTYPFKSPQWNNATTPLVSKIFNTASVFIFEAHSETLYKMLAVVPSVKDPAALIRTYQVFDVVILYFYIGAGSMLLLLATMYWFGKLHKTKYEFGEMINRTMVGFVLTLVGIIGILSNRTEYGFKFSASSWIIPIVVFAFLAVIALDNILLGVANKTYKRRSAWSTTSTMLNPNDDDDDDTESLVKNTQSRPETAQSYNPQNFPYSPPQDFHLTSPPPQGNTGSHSREPSRSTTPVPMPIHMAMGNNFKPSHSRENSYELQQTSKSKQDSPNRPPVHKRGRSGGYAVVGDGDDMF